MSAQWTHVARIDWEPVTFADGLLEGIRCWFPAKHVDAGVVSIPYGLIEHSDKRGGMVTYRLNEKTLDWEQAELSKHAHLPRKDEKLYAVNYAWGLTYEPYHQRQKK